MSTKRRRRLADFQNLQHLAQVLPRVRHPHIEASSASTRDCAVFVASSSESLLHRFFIGRKLP